MEATIVHSTCDGEEPEKALLLVASFIEGGTAGLFAEDALNYFNNLGLDETVAASLGYLKIAARIDQMTFFQLLAFKGVPGFKAHSMHLEPSEDMPLVAPEEIGVEHLNEFIIAARQGLNAYERMVEYDCPPNAAVNVLPGGVPVDAFVSFDLWSLIMCNYSASIINGNVGPVISLLRRKVVNLWPWVEDIRIWS